jgi:hypothetical protein
MARWSLSPVAGDTVQALRESFNRQIQDQNLILAELEQVEQQVKGQNGYAPQISNTLDMQGNDITGLPHRPADDTAACSLAFHKSGDFLYSESDTFIAEKPIQGLTARTPSELVTLGQLQQAIQQNNPALAPLYAAVPFYPSNAAAIAGGLAIGALYRTGSADPDPLCVVE